MPLSPPKILVFAGSIRTGSFNARLAAVMVKELTLLGYFTSEIGYTQAMRYTETPGRFDPCVPYTTGEKSWAPHA